MKLRSFVWKLIFKHYKTHFVFLQNKLKKMCFLFLFISILCNNRNLYKTMYSIYSHPLFLLVHFKDSSNWLQTSRNGWHHHWLWHYWMGLIIQWCPLLKTLCSKTRKIPLKSCVLMAYIVPQARVGWWWWLHQHHQWCFCCEAPIALAHHVRLLNKEKEGMCLKRTLNVLREMQDAKRQCLGCNKPSGCNRRSQAASCWPNEAVL